MYGVFHQQVVRFATVREDGDASGADARGLKRTAIDATNREGARTGSAFDKARGVATKAALSASICDINLVRSICAKLLAYKDVGDIGGRLEVIDEGPTKLRGHEVCDAYVGHE